MLINMNYVAPEFLNLGKALVELILDKNVILSFPTVVENEDIEFQYEFTIGARPNTSGTFAWARYDEQNESYILFIEDMLEPMSFSTVEELISMIK